MSSLVICARQEKKYTGNEGGRDDILVMSDDVSAGILD